MFQARLLRNSQRQLEKLDTQVARRITRRIRWLAEHYEEINPEPLKGELEGLFKYRDGDYRIIYQPIPAEEVLLIHEIGHRSEIYKRRS